MNGSQYLPFDSHLPSCLRFGGSGFSNLWADLGLGLGLGFRVWGLGFGSRVDGVGFEVLWCGVCGMRFKFGDPVITVTLDDGTLGPDGAPIEKTSQSQVSSSSSLLLSSLELSDTKVYQP